MKKILIVEDYPSIREMIDFSLNNSGFSVEVAKDGEVALKMLEEQDFDILLTDVKMPKIEGTELAEMVSHKYPGIKIIVMSGYDVNGDNMPFDFIAKPFDHDTLVMMLNS